MSTKRKERQAMEANKQMTQWAGGVIAVVVIYLIVQIVRTNIAASTSDMPSVDPDIEVITTASGLQYQDKEVGVGPAAEAGQTVSVHYTGWLTDGTQFDSSLDRGQPFEFVLGTGSVIAGWDEGVVGMQVGGTRVLIIPAELGYGEFGSGEVIPPGATLIFEVSLLEIR